MKITPQQTEDLTALIIERAPAIAQLIGQAVLANAQHPRPAAVTLAIKIARNADDPRLIEVTSQQKIKAPKSRCSDLTSWDEPEELMGFKTHEEAGQQKLDD